MEIALSDINEIQSTLNAIQADLGAVKENVNELAKYVYKGNGRESLLVRTARVEEKVEELNWVKKAVIGSLGTCLITAVTVIIQLLA